MGCNCNHGAKIIIEYHFYWIYGKIVYDKYTFPRALFRHALGRV